MMNASRRAFMGVAASVSAAAMLAACAALDPNNTPQQNLAQVVADVSSIATAFGKALPQIQALNLSEDIRARINASVANLQAVTVAVAAAATSTTAEQPLIQKVETDVNAVVDALAAIPLPVPLSSIIQAATILLPIIEIAVGLVVPAQAKARAGAIPMSPDEARAVLRLNS